VRIVTGALRSHQSDQKTALSRIGRASFSHATRLVADSQTIYLWTKNEIWSLENVLRSDELADDMFARFYAPRSAHLTGAAVLAADLGKFGLSARIRAWRSRQDRSPKRQPRECDVLSGLCAWHGVCVAFCNCRCVAFPTCQFWPVADRRDVEGQRRRAAGCWLLIFVMVTSCNGTGSEAMSRNCSTSVLFKRPLSKRHRPLSAG
jgi:hypothetical protein